MGRRIVRVLFAGTPEIAVPSLRMVASHHTVVGVLTNPDRPSGRARRLVSPPVKVLADELGLPVFQFDTLRGEARKTLFPLKADLLVVFAFGRIFGPKFLELFPEGAINVHPSLLPAYRGSIPLIAPIINGDHETGVTIQKIALELDSGDILHQTKIPLDESIDAEVLTELSAQRGADMLRDVLEKMERRSIVPEPQDPMKATYCRRLSKEDGRINWNLPAVMIERMVRGFKAWPKAFTFFRGVRLSLLKTHVLSGDWFGESAPLEQKKETAGTVLGIDKKNGILIQTGKNILCVEKLQLQGKKPLAWDAFINGNRDLEGSKLGEN